MISAIQSRTFLLAALVFFTNPISYAVEIQAIDSDEDGVLRIAIAPSQTPPSSYPGSPIVFELRLVDVTISGQRMLENPDDISPLEEFHFSMFRTAKGLTSAEDLRELMEDASHARLVDTMDENPELVGSYQAAYARYDDTRVLGAVEYGSFIRLFTEHLDSRNIYPTACPTSSIIATADGYKLTDGPGSVVPDAVSSLFGMGPLNDAICDYFRSVVDN